MKNFNNFKRGNKFGGGGFKGRSEGGRPNHEMFTATCASCNKSCEVPFRPNGMKPVYCNDCFSKNGGPAKSDGFQKKPFGQKSFGDRPRFDAPRQAPQDTKKFDELAQQLESVNAKLEKIIAIAEAMTVKKEKAPAKKAAAKKSK